MVSFFESNVEIKHGLHLIIMISYHGQNVKPRSAPKEACIADQ